MSFQSEFVNPMRGSSRYKEWALDNPGQATKFEKYAASIAAGKRPEIPFMVGQFGKALIGAGKPWLPPAAPPPTPPPVTSSSVFAGRGAFTAHDPLVLVREGIADRFDWVALKGDGGDHAAIADAAALRAAGVKRVLVWYSWDGEVTLYPGDVNAGGWIGQAEGPGQLEKCQQFAGAPWPMSRAIVSNVYMPSWPAGWYCLGEAYVGTNPNATPAKIEYEARKRGATAYSPVFSVYDGSSEVDGGRKVPLKEYRAMWPGANWAVYTAEYLDAADIAYLKALPR